MTTTTPRRQTPAGPGRARTTTSRRAPSRPAATAKTPAARKASAAPRTTGTARKPATAARTSGAAASKPGTTRAGSVTPAASTTARQPGTTARKPDTTARQPAAVASTAALQPRTAARKPATAARKPATAARKPATAALKPSAGPRLAAGKPSAGARPAAGKPSAGARPAAREPSQAPRRPAGAAKAEPARRYQLGTSFKRLTPAERAERGRQLRADVPRTSHAEFAPGRDRPDPIAMLQAQSVTRLPDLVPIRYGRMLASPFSYFRGAALPMASDLSGTPVTGLAVQACGDAHLGNFGLFGTAERRLVFDINDFDETQPGPWEWDVKRLAASLEVAARDNGIGKRGRAGIVRAAAERYRLAMREFATQTNLQVFYARADIDDMRDRLAGRLSAGQRSRLAKGIDKARTRDSMQALEKLCRVVDGRPQIVADPPLVIPLSSLVPADVDPSGIEKLLVTAVDGYKRTLSGDRRYLLDQYRHELADVARKVVGVGSVGTRCWIMLMLGRDSDDPLFLQMKEAGPSVLSEYVGRSRYEHQGQRVVEGQRLMQAASDVFLGWHRMNPAPDGVVRDFYIRQLRDWKFSLDTQAMKPSGLSYYGQVCGWTLARAHARSGDRIALAAYLGTSDTFDRAIAEFAAAYADQNERDYAALNEAATFGRVLAQRGV